ncbi:glycosyltransferase [Azospirillum brasilense]|uniref:glycosyltransferase n=1 Tax=Azospirillum brasilense TaxID=192 RepID=UPI001EDC722C|nr:glycosyltransferase [Azospirillum brasilense]UKJ78111.1 glycosyltransferase [Azospirillum brasilense]
MIFETLDRIGRAGARVQRFAAVGPLGAIAEGAETLALDGPPASWVERLAAEAAEGTPIDGLLAGGDEAVRALLAADTDGRALDALAVVLVAGEAARPPLAAPLFDRGFVPLRGDGELRAYVRSSRLADPALAGGGGPASVSMTTLGGNGRFANQLFQYAFLRLYGLRAGVGIAVPAWEGEGLFGLSDPRPGAEPHPELRFYGFDDDDLALWAMDAPPVGVDFWGYFQEVPESWTRHRDFLRRLFRLRADWSEPVDAAVAGLRAQGRTLVVLHVRRGDYAGFDKRDLPWYRIVPTLWHRAWLEAVWPTLAAPILHIATDDPGAVLPEFEDYPQLDAAALRAATGMPAHVLDFALLARADRLVLANSSFSRFAALLAGPEQRAVLPDFQAKGFVPYEPWADRAFWQRFATPEACRDTYGSTPAARLRRSLMVRGMLGQTQAALRWNEGQVAALTREAERLARLNGNLENLLTERDAAANAQVENLLAERDAAIADRQTAIAIVAGEYEETLARLSVEHTAAVGRLSAERDAARNEREALKAAHRAELDAVAASTSWRVTAPLRLSSRLLRGVARKARRAVGLTLRRDWPGLRAALLTNLTRGAPPARPADQPSETRSPAERGNENRALSHALRKPARAIDALVAGSSARVTVVIPCYNYGAYVADAVRSVLDQTYPRVDVVVVDDGSTDPDTRAAVDALAGPRVRVHRQVNQGLSTARNNGAALSDADYLMFLDADDRLAPVAVAALLAELEANPDRAFAYCHQRFFGDTELVWAPQPYNAYDLLWANHPSVCALVRGDWFRRSPGYRPQMLFGYEDWEFWLALSAMEGYGLCVPVPAFEHRRHGVTMTHEAHRRQRFLAGRIRHLNAPLYRLAAVAERKAEWRPLVSVIIPFYNGHLFLDETLASLGAQTMRDFEVILANDGSEHPDSLAMLERLRERTDLRVLDCPHRGLPATRNAGALAARGEYIFYLDSDDLLDPTALEKLALAAATRPGTAFIYSGVVHFGAIEGVCLDPFDRERLTRENYLAFSCLIRRDVYIAVGGMDEGLTDCYEDYDFWLRLIDAGHEGYLVPEPLFRYRRHNLGNRTKLARETSHEDMLERLRQRNPGLYGRPPVDRSGWKLIAPESPFDGLRPEIRALAEVWQTHVGVPTDRYRRPNTPLPFPPTQWRDPRTGVLFFIPHCAIGGAERVDLEILAGLPRDRFHVTLLVEQAGEHPWLDRYRTLVDEVVLLPSLTPDAEEQQAVCLHYAMARAADLVFVRNSGLGYRFVERLKAITDTVRAVDLLHLHCKDGDWVRASVLHHDQLDRRFVITRELRDHATQTYALDEDRFEVIHCGVDPARALAPEDRAAHRCRIRETFSIPLEARTIGFVGRVAAQKDPLRWIETAAVLAQAEPDLHFLVVGDGELMEEMKAAADRLGVAGCIRFAGYHADADPFIAAMDLLLVSSAYEGLPLVIMEAMLQGVPVVSTDTGGTAECLDDRLGALVPADAHPDVLARAVLDVLARAATDPELPVLTRARILDGFSTPRMQERYRETLVALGAGLDRDKRLSDYQLRLMEAPLFR